MLAAGSAFALQTNADVPWLPLHGSALLLGAVSAAHEGMGASPRWWPETTTEQIRVHMETPALLREHHVCMYLQTALPKQPVFQIAFFSCIPYGTGMPGLGQLWGKECQPHGWCGILSDAMVWPCHLPAMCVLSWAGCWACA